MTLTNILLFIHYLSFTADDDDDVLVEKVFGFSQQISFHAA